MRCNMCHDTENRLQPCDMTKCKKNHTETLHPKQTPVKNWKISTQEKKPLQNTLKQ
jgi:hypothetical protein